jgi:hypothetical protein
MTVVSPSLGAGAGATGDGLTEGGGVVVVCSADVADVADVVEVVVVVVLFEPALSPPHPVVSEPAATPAASAKRAEFGIARRVVMSSRVTRATRQLNAVNRA